MANIQLVEAAVRSKDNNNLNLFGADKKASGSFFDTSNIAVNTTKEVETLFGSDRVFDEKKSKDVTKKMQESFSNIDVTNETNADILMSQTLSGKDYAKAKEDGFNMKDVDAKKTVTILDRIKAVLAKSGNVTNGFNDNIDKDVLEEITGNKAFANEIINKLKENDLPLSIQNIEQIKEAVVKSSEISSLSESAVMYLIENELPITVDNLYLASHTTNGQTANRGTYYMQEGGYMAERATTLDFSSLREQIEEVVKQAGLDSTNEENILFAQKMLEEGFTLTPESLIKKITLDNLTFPLPLEEVISSAVSALADGQRADKGDVTNQTTQLDKALEQSDMQNEWVDKNPEKAAFIFKKVEDELRNQKEDIDEIKRGVQSDYYLEEGVVSNEKYEEIKNRLRLEEIRYTFSVEANLRMIQSGITLDTTSMENQIRQLQDILLDMGKSLFGEGTSNTAKASELSVEAKFTLFRQTTYRVSGIMESPAAVIGALKDEFKVDTLDAIYQKSTTIKMSFDKAMQAYEMVSTRPDDQFGESIEKAFRNVDDILKELNLEENDDNRRAVRILGYNHAEITKESILQVKAWDAKLTSTMDRLKPGAVLQMIRDGKNPLNMTLEELGGYLDKQNSQSDKDGDNDKYSEFLYKLERKNGITKEEKESYIGIFRLFANLKATDDAAIGMVLRTKGEMTIGNLLTANRTVIRSMSSMDYRIDDEFGGIESGKSFSPSIDEQINMAFLFYSSRADSVYEHIDADKLADFKPTNETFLTDLADAMEEEDKDLESTEDYNSRQLREIRDIFNNENTKSDMKVLTNAFIPITASNLEAMKEIRESRKKKNVHGKDVEPSLWQKLREKIGENDDNAFENIKDLENYDTTLDKIKEQLEKTLETTDKYIDLRVISLLHKDLSVSRQLSESGSYEVPVEVGDDIISMHVTLVNNEEEGSHITTSLDTGTLGIIKTDLQIQKNKIIGVIATSNAKSAQSQHFLEDVKNRISEKMNMEIEAATIFYSRDGEFEREIGNRKGTKKEELLTLAKEVIESIAACVKEREVIFS